MTQVELSIEYDRVVIGNLHLGETPTYQMKEYCDANQNDIINIGRVLESGTEEGFSYIIL